MRTIHLAVGAGIEPADVLPRLRLATGHITSLSTYHLLLEYESGFEPELQGFAILRINHFAIHIKFEHKKRDPSKTRISLGT